MDTDKDKLVSTRCSSSFWKRCFVVFCEPVKRPRQDEIVICREFLKPGLELALVDEAAGFVDDDEGVDNPGKEKFSTA